MQPHEAANKVWRRVREALGVPDDEPVIPYARALRAENERLRSALRELRSCALLVQRDHAFAIDPDTLLDDEERTESIHINAALAATIEKVQRVLEGETSVAEGSESDG